MNITKPAEDKLILKAENRTIVGKAVKSLRNKGVLPGNIFGSEIKSQAISVQGMEFNKIYKEAGETKVIYLEIGTTTTPTLITSVDKHPVSEKILHIDFRKVNLKEKIEANVPVEFEGESEAVARKNGILIMQTDEVAVEALPTDIPEKILVNISSLTEIGMEIKISDLAKSDKYDIMDEPEKVIVSVTEHKEESIEPETVAEAPEILTEKSEESEVGSTGEGDTQSTDSSTTKEEEKK